jgi:NO-binding membrane sensor protein with MHYT domain
MPEFLHLVLTPPDSSLLYVGRWDWLLVGLSVGIAVLASFAAFLVSQQIVAGAKTGRRW